MIFIYIHTLYSYQKFLLVVGTHVPTFFYDIFAKRMLVFRAVWLMLVQACQ